MNINRHNYEEFFLLYVDNELSAGQRKIVEAFVAVNPDLQEEFNLIQQSIFTADEKLDAKFITSLLKPVEEESSILFYKKKFNGSNAAHLKQTSQLYFLINHYCIKKPSLQEYFIWVLLQEDGPPLQQ